MKRAFTLVELLVVIGIMGLLGTLSVGGYRAMQRGMAERGVMDNVDSFVRAAYQRAQIDRQPTAVFFWNETMRSAQGDDNATEIVVGKAVAVRRHGRLTGKEGDLLIDEFADLDKTYDVETGGDNALHTMYLYPMDRLGDLTSGMKRSLVYANVYSDDGRTPYYLSGDANGTLGGIVSSGGTLGEIVSYGFKRISGYSDWNVGTAYGFEFGELTLPHNFIFGTSYSTDLNSPIMPQGVLVFSVGGNSGTGTSGGLIGNSGITVSSLLPNASGELSAQSIGTSRDPSQNLEN